MNKIKKKNYIAASNGQSATKNKKLESIIKLYSHVDRKSSYGYSSARGSERRNLALLSSEKKKEMKSEIFSDSIIIKLKSNWGNNNHIGLGTIKFFSKSKTQIPITNFLISIETINNISTVKISQNNQTPNKNGTLLPIPFSRNKIVSIEAKFNKSVQDVYEIYISNYNGIDKGISARDILITNGKGELIYTDSLARGSALHIERSQNGIFIPIKRIIVNRKNSLLKGINQIQLIQRVNSIEAIRKSEKAFSENKNELKIIKSKTLSLIKTKSKPPQVTPIPTKYDKIKIIFEATHGHLHHIGLTGIILYENGKPLQIDEAKTIGAMPKDLCSVLGMEGDERIFENVFNGNNLSADQSQMWLTLFNQDNQMKPFIEITFHRDISLNKIKFFNFNDYYSLEKGVKFGEIILYKDEKEEFKRKFYLRMGVGENDIDYGQEVFLDNNLEKELSEPLINKYWVEYKKYKCDYNLMKYFTPFAPCGYVIKIELITNEGNDKYIGLRDIKLFDLFCQEIDSTRYRRVIVPNYIKTVNNKIKCNEVITDYIDLKKNIDTEESSKIYFFFDEFIFLSYIKFINLNVDDTKRVRDIKVLVEGKIVFEGKMPGQINEGIILFINSSSIGDKLDKQKLCMGNYEQTAYEEVCESI